ncbi:MAG TPA: TPM domain-containing protein [Methanomassiliicoccales archaeon]|nr:TPM domain-containing protein [Methanomassiliicoccales archaeon]
MNRTGRVLLGSAAIVIAALLIFLVIVPAIFPPKDTRFEGIPTLEYYVTDNVNALSLDSYYSVDDICYFVDDNTSCEMAVLIVNSTQPREANEFALRTFQLNELGKAGKDNGVLILIVTETKEWKVEVGYGLEGVLTPTFVNRVAQDQVVPYLEVEDYDSAVYNMALYLGAEIIDKYEAPQSGDPAYPIGGIPLTWWQWVIAIIVVVAVLIVTRGRALFLLFLLLSRGGGRGGFGGGRSGGGGAGGRY